ncbi:MAG: carbon-nitrogen hydrolase family protein [Anaerolineae bacterium]|nr:carbon-nitrogen hydrolase family protein [Anaerolineae bacterium]MDW8099980.1 carbon-nitrogen hydrolase family protein [Anaerolineae bacterium]
MTRWITVSAVQIPGDRVGEPEKVKQANLEQACEMLAEAGRRGSDIALLGEMFPFAGIALTTDILERFADEVSGPTFQRLSAVAQTYRMYILAPVLSRCAGRLYNCTWILGREGEFLGHYHKVHLTQMERSLGLSPGDVLSVFRLDFGVIGIMTCHDNSFPECARCLALEGAEVLFWPHMMSGWGELGWDAVYYRSRTIDNDVYLVAACHGISEGRAWRPGMIIGRSAIINRDGLTLAEAGRYSGIATAAIDLDRRRIAHDFTRPGDWVYWEDVCQDRRPEVYKAIVRQKEARAIRNLS